MSIQDTNSSQTSQNTSTSTTETPVTVTTTMTSPTVTQVPTRRQVPIFDGKDYGIWSQLMLCNLEDLELRDYVTKSQADIADHKNELDRRAKHEIILAITPTEAKRVIHLTTAREVWEGLKNHHQKASSANQFQLRFQLLNAKLKASEIIGEYSDRLRDLATQINSMTDEAASIKDQDLVLTLLNGLPDRYQMLITAMSESDKLGDLEHVITSLKAQESREQGTDEQALFTGRGRGRGNRGNRGNRGQYRGQGRGQYRSRGQNSQRARFDGNCNYCDKYGHSEKFCYRKRDEQGGNNNDNNKDNKNKGGKQANNANSSQSSTKGGLFYANSTANPATTTTAYLSDNEEENCWLMDSGATQHMTSCKEWFRTYMEFDRPVPIKLGNNNIIYAKGKGEIGVQLQGDVANPSSTLTDILYAPNIRKNLFSIGKTMSIGNWKIILHGDGAVIMDLENNREIRSMTAFKKGNLYIINCTPEGDIQSYSARSSLDEIINLWHRRLGHIGKLSLRRMARNRSVIGLPDNIYPDENFICDDCMANKATIQPFEQRRKRASGALDLVHSDICGPMRTRTSGGRRFFITFIDDYSRKAFVYFLSAKNEALAKFKEFKAYAENVTGQRIKSFRSDNGREYINHPFEQYLTTWGIQHQTSAPYTPQQNGVAERFNRTVVEMARTMLNAINSKLGNSFWAEAIHTVTYIRNRCTSRSLEKETDDQHRHDNLTPEELWTRKKPNVTHLRVFGCEAYVLNKENNRSKFDEKANKCLFLGYKDRAYKLWNPNKRRIVMSRDVTFKERQEPSVKETDTYIPGVQTSQSTSTSTFKQRTSSMMSSSVSNQTSSVPGSQEKSSSSEPIPPME